MASTMDAITFTKAKTVCPDFNSSKVSKLKVEKVLNPPQNPVIRNKRKALLVISFDSIMIKNIASNILANKLLINVPQGKCFAYLISAILIE